MTTALDEELMTAAITAAAAARRRSAPNPWVGAVVVTVDGRQFHGATAPPGGPHAEVSAFAAARAAGAELAGATLYSTLEPCSHHGRTPPCTDAILAAGVRRVVVGIEDPDQKVAGRGIAQLRQGGCDVEVGVCAEQVTEQLRPYLHHRSTGRPYVVLKMAATLDGRIAARDGSSQWITSPQARQRVHELRADSQAICTGAGTVRADDPELTVRHVDGPDPRRVVVGSAPAGAKVHPCLEWDGPLDELLDRLGAEGVLQLLVESGPRLAASFHRGGLVDRYVLHLAPAFAGGDAQGMFAGDGIETISALWRGRVVAVAALGPDLEVVVEK
ncbi:MAG: bifunctional diaminohydroxyphosphoribosylaminopyrimidine deaminase/5-amino-6-(5-phosphoribosylamino)uracil reductase RibD [Ilumatobacteraceae bacterium]